VASVHLGYFKNFKARDTLLVEGDAEGLRNLAAVLRSLQCGSPEIVAVDALPFVQSHHGVRLTAKRSQSDRVARMAPSSVDFTWERTEAGWRAATDKVEELLDRDAGHQYLDRAGDQVVVEISKGEYGSGWWQDHG